MKTKKQTHKSVNKVWFDNECKNSKLKLQSLGKHYKNEKDNTVLRKEISDEKKV